MGRPAGWWCPVPEHYLGLIRTLIRGIGLGDRYAEVAQRAGVDEGLIRKLVTGDTGLSEKTAEALAPVLKVHPEVLLLGSYMERADRRAEEAEAAERERREREGQ